MDPPTLMNESSFPAGNGAPYNFSEIWPFPISGGGESSSRPLFLADVSPFGGDGAVSTDPDAYGRRRRDSDEEEAAKSVSTSSANAMVVSQSSAGVMRTIVEVVQLCHRLCSSLVIQFPFNLMSGPSIQCLGRYTQ